jgi:hypothetical protein
MHRNENGHGTGEFKIFAEDIGPKIAITHSDMQTRVRAHVYRPPRNIISDLRKLCFRYSLLRRVVNLTLTFYENGLRSSGLPVLTGLLHSSVRRTKLIIIVPA